MENAKFQCEIAKSLNAQGCHHQWSGEYAASIQCFEKSLQNAAEHPVALNNLGNSFVSVGEYGKAASAYRRAINAEPTRAFPYGNLAVLHQLTGDNDSAINYFGQYLELVSNDGDAWHNLGLLLKEQQRDEKARLAFENAARFLVPDSAEATTKLGVGCFFRGDLELALSLFEESLTQDPFHIPARYHLGVTLLCLGRSADAIEWLESVIDAAPDYPQADVNLAVAYNTDGQSDKAIAFLEQLLADRPNDAELILNLGFAYQEANRFDDAEGAFRDLIALPNASADQVEKARSALQNLGIQTA